MGANLPTLARVINFSGQSGNSTDLDPLFFPVEGASTSDITYKDQGGQPGFDFALGAKYCLSTAIPLGAFNTDAAVNADVLSIEWEQNFVGTTGSIGGPMFYHYSRDHYDQDGAGYFLNFVRSSGTMTIRMFNRVSDTGAITQNNPTPSPATINQSGWVRLRFTLSVNGASNHLKAEEWDGAAWVTHFDLDDTTTIGDMFGIGWRSGGGPNNLEVRGPNGESGPVVVFKGPSFVAAAIGQSEFVGSAPGLQVNLDENLCCVNAQGVFVSPLTDPWVGTSAAHPTWPGSDGQNGSPEGSFIPKLADRLKVLFPTQCWSSISLRGGTTSAQHAPPAATARYDINLRGGVRDLMTTILAGDGRTPGQRLVHFYWQGTADAVNAISEATIVSNITAITDRVNALFPTSDVYLATHGDRTYAPGSPTTAESQVVRYAHQQIILSGKAKAWFDDQDFVGAPGINRGWSDIADTLHPGTTDNQLLSITADEHFLSRAFIAGELSLGEIDGMTDRSFREALLAYIAGNSTVIDNLDGTKTITYKKQDGITDKLIITFNTSGEFTSTQITP